MDHNNDEHLYLFSRRAVGLFFERLDFPVLEFENPVYSYDMFFTASGKPLAKTDAVTVSEALARHPTGRLVQALLDKAPQNPRIGR